MILLLGFLLGLFVLSVATADHPIVRPRAVPLLLICVIVSVGFMSRRVI